MRVGLRACGRGKRRFHGCFRNGRLQFFPVVAVFCREALISKSHGYAS